MEPRLSLPGLRMLDRRRFLGDALTGLSGIAAASLLAGERVSADDAAVWSPTIDPSAPHAPRSGHDRAAARRVLVLFCSGACSHLDTFDYKPELIRRHGEPMPGADSLITFQGEQGALTKSPYRFVPRGESGKYTSDLLPQLGAWAADHAAFLHSMTGKSNTHGPGENYLSTGFTLEGFPSMGAWTSYALGTENQDLPAFVAIPDPRGVPQSAINNWGAGFLPATFQGTTFNAQQPIRNLARPESLTAEQDLATRQLIERMNRRHLERYPGDRQLAARIAAYELAARMQQSIPDVVDLTSEPQWLRDEYGADDPDPVVAGFARNCLLARRLLEEGVRFVQLFNGAYAMGEGVGNWDGHKTLQEQYDRHGRILDRAAAALMNDLQRRGLLEDTLVVWCTEFGRMPTFQKGASGRDHNPSGFTVWLAGAGVRPGIAYGATDEFGYRAVENVLTVHDLHATMLHLLGLDHERLTYYHNGLQRRLTDVEGRVVREILA
ncbi:MAG TPA: DUF1501 domain-containing protein [Planctomycetaceae bacterium]|nr:DUF1501 domain-containing protein [Planctomycetaceae bacterium]HRE99350.1 DUF1501 domain-containing protein [Pirellulaceae bacterium]